MMYTLSRSTSTRARSRREPQSAGHCFTFDGGSLLGGAEAVHSPCTL